jgi:uncharacterized LabA/DUF88 family protein
LRAYDHAEIVTQGDAGMPLTTEANSALAVLIDADNARSQIIGELLREVAKFGIATVKRIYGNWTTPQLAGWKDVLLEHSVQPIQQFANTTGKNATDSALIIDAMDLLYVGRLDGFCIVSSDSDFTRLASRLRESGRRVYGFGERKTPRAFVAACDRFIYTEVFATGQDSAKRAADRRPSDSEELRLLLRSAVEAVSEDDGWAHLGAIGNWLTKQSPDFDPRIYGFAKLSELIKATKIFTLEKREGGLWARATT